MKAESRLKELVEKEEINSLDGAKKEGFIQGWNEALRIQNVSDMFSFAKYLKEGYDYYDNTEDGDIYIHKGNKLKYTEYKIYLTWSNYR